jgi:hypothetical protein
MSSYIIKNMPHVWYQWGEGDIWVRVVRGEVGLVGMRQLILSMGLVWLEVCSLSQYLFYYHTCVEYCIAVKMLV